MEKYENRAVITPYQILPNKTGHVAFQGIGLYLTNRPDDYERLEVDLNKSMDKSTNIGVMDVDVGRSIVRQGFMPSYPSIKFSRSATNALGYNTVIDQFTLPESTVANPSKSLSKSFAELVNVDHMYSSLGNIALVNIYNTNHKDTSVGYDNVCQLGANRLIDGFGGPMGYFTVAFLHPGDEIAIANHGRETIVGNLPEEGGLVIAGSKV